VFLTGSHTWNTLVDIGATDPPIVLDFSEYLDFLESRNHNFFRLWTWHMPCTWNKQHYVQPLPWPRSGGGTALDGKPKFDLYEHDHEYFSRLRERVSLACKRGFYASVMLFEGNMTLERVYQDTWKHHPFVGTNNINGFDLGMSHPEGVMLEWITLTNPRVIDVQERYVRKVIDTVNGFDNVLYEISNEAGIHSHEWQEHWIDFIRTYEKTKAKRHLIGITGGVGTQNKRLFASAADWMSPDGQDDQPEEGYKKGSYTWGKGPHDTSDKVVLVDTDHLWGLGGNADWGCRSFCRGYNVIYMDRCDDFPWSWYEHERFPTLHDDGLRLAMGKMRSLTEQVDLSRMVPRNELSSTGYCLANEGFDYIVYQPSGDPFRVTIEPGIYRATWHRAESWETAATTRVAIPERVFMFSPPFQGGAILQISRIAKESH
jgi:hypothetical protein